MPRPKSQDPARPHSIRVPDSLWAEVEQTAADWHTTPTAIILERIRGSFSDSLDVLDQAVFDEVARTRLAALRPHPRLDTITAGQLRRVALALNALAARW